MNFYKIASDFFDFIKTFQQENLPDCFAIFTGLQLRFCK